MLPFLLRLLARLPLSVLHTLGKLCGLIIYMLPGRYRDRLRANAAQAGYTDPAFLRRAAGHTGALILETPRVWLNEPASVAATTVADPDVLAQARAEGRGILFLTPHLGCYEVVARTLASVKPLTVMFREPRQKALREVVEQARNNSIMRAVPATQKGVREFVRALRRGEAVGMLPDQVPGQGEGVWAPFFGRSAYTVTLPGRLAQQTGAIVLMVAGERLPAGRGWRMHVVRVPEPLPVEPEAQAALFNTAMAALIARFPEQYLWSYNRYKVPATARSPGPPAGDASAGADIKSPAPRTNPRAGDPPAGHTGGAET
ncbi:MAG: lysophospholipid acyltransferase family protein [Comamonadaceae bacterium]|nr:MAG: lysophospholipid acyltransferase family protein [Comamonadaceae bacterium]